MTLFQDSQPVTNDHRNANQNDNDISPHTTENVLYQKVWEQSVLV